MSSLVVVAGVAGVAGVAAIAASTKTVAVDSGSKNPGRHSDGSPCLKGELSGPALQRAMAAGLRASAKGQLTPEGLRILVAHGLLETGNGSALWDGNAWNLICYKADQVSCLRGDALPDGTPRNQRFRVYPSLGAGADSYFRQLAFRYPLAIEGANQGDPEKWAYGMKHGNEGYEYFEISEAHASRSIAGLLSNIRLEDMRA